MRFSGGPQSNPEPPNCCASSLPNTTDSFFPLPLLGGLEFSQNQHRLLRYLNKLDAPAVFSSRAFVGVAAADIVIDWRRARG